MFPLVIKHLLATDVRPARLVLRVLLLYRLLRVSLITLHSCKGHGGDSSVVIRELLDLQCTGLGKRVVPRLRELVPSQPEGVRGRDSRNLGTTLLPSPV